MNINKIIDIIHTLKEGGMVTGAASTNNTGSGPEGAGYGGSAQGFKSSHAGYDKPLDGRSVLARKLPPAYRQNLQKTKKKKI
jgi:hypothetical protein